MKESKKFRFNKEDFLRVSRGLVIAMAGTGFTYLTSVITGSDFEIIVNDSVINLTPFVVAGWSVFVNIVRVWLQGKR